MLRKTKIVCTLGPSTDDENVMRSLIEEGMNVARFNFHMEDTRSSLEDLRCFASCAGG